MVSERKPNDDKRRLIPGEYLDEALLTALAEAPERDNRPVRLVSRVGNAFEFVHDQMHAFLAARWFTQGERSVTELVKEVSTTSVWSESVPARRTLWSFVAIMLDDQRLQGLWACVE
jgi:hypothetical protein